MSREAFSNQYVTGSIVHEMWSQDGTCRCMILTSGGQHIRATVLGCDPGAEMIGRRVKRTNDHWSLTDDRRRAA